MSFRTFFLCLSASFGVAWLAIIIVPYLKMRSMEPVMFAEETGTDAVYIPKRAGRIQDGSEVYAENGCYLCHTQVIRPTYAGNDLFRPDWGGFIYDDERGDSRRETNAFDYSGEDFAHIGVARNGPDLSNLGIRVEQEYAKGISPEQWLYRFLYNPQFEPERRNATCPPLRFLFEEQELYGPPSNDALPLDAPEGMEILPTSKAKALVSYLLSLKKDQSVPASLDFSPRSKETGESPAESSEAP